MEKVYSLVKMELPIQKGSALEINLLDDTKIETLGLYNRENVEILRFPEDTFQQEGNVLTIFPLKIPTVPSEELIVGVKTDKDELSYLEYSQRQSKHLWEASYDFGLPENSSVNLYIIIDLGGKITFANVTKMETDTNRLRLPVVGKMESIAASKSSFTFSFSLQFDPLRMDVNKDDIKPILSLVDPEFQRTIAIEDYSVTETADGYLVSGKLNLDGKNIESGNYCFGVQLQQGTETYLLNIYQISKELFNDVHPYTNDRFTLQGYDCEVFWFDREGMIFRINGAAKKNFLGMLKNKYSFTKQLSTKEQEKWDKAYVEFQKGWTHRSSLRNFK